MNRLMAVPNIWFTEPVMKFMEGFDYQKLSQKLAFNIDCVGKCKYKYLFTTCMRSAYALHRFAVSAIACILHECKQVVIQFLNDYNIVGLYMILNMFWYIFVETGCVILSVCDLLKQFCQNDCQCFNRVFIYPNIQPVLPCTLAWKPCCSLQRSLC